VPRPPADRPEKTCGYRDGDCEVVLAERRATYCKVHGPVVAEEKKAVTDAASNAAKAAAIAFAKAPQEAADGGLLIGPSLAAALVVQPGSLQDAIDRYYRSVVRLNTTTAFGMTEYVVADTAAFMAATSALLQAAKQARDAINAVLYTPEA